jgi:phage-related protein
MAVTFAGNSFHLGWAELILGWLLALAEAQTSTALDAADAISASDEAMSEHRRLSKETEAALGGRRRCYIEEVEEGRYLFHNFRRTSSGAPKKLLL